jgi:Flp pilus assembly protein TadG
MAIEVVILAPVLIAVMMLIVGLGRYVDRRGDIEAMARDAVRSASLQRDVSSARQAAQAIVDSTRPDGVTCAPIDLSGNFEPGGMISVRVDCQVSFNGLGFAGFPGNATLEGESFAPIDSLRGTL